MKQCSCLSPTAESWMDALYSCCNSLRLGQDFISIRGATSLSRTDPSGTIIRRKFRFQGTSKALAPSMNRHCHSARVRWKWNPHEYPNPWIKQPATRLPSDDIKHLLSS